MTQNDNNGENSSSDFPRPGSMFYNMAFNEKSKKRYIRLFKLFNKIIIPLYRLKVLSILGFGRRLLILSTKGRKSGKIRKSGLEYFRINNAIHIISGFGQKSDWFKNMIANPDHVYVQVGFRKFHANIEVLEEAETEDVFRWFAKNHSTYMKAGFGWNPKQDNPETADFSSLTRILKVIRIHKSIVGHSASSLSTTGNHQ
ncbi:MAG: nitroreductase family deazaflavin-dependent oxidoreductase [Promethearchaeota archaeon]